MNAKSDTEDELTNSEECTVEDVQPHLNSVQMFQEKEFVLCYSDCIRKRKLHEYVAVNNSANNLLSRSRIQNIHSKCMLRQFVEYVSVNLLSCVL